MEITAFQLLLGICAAAAVGFAKTGIPGVGILVVPLVAMVFPAKQSVGAVLPMLILADIFAVTYYRRHVRWDRLWGLFPAVALGIAAGSLLLDAINDAQLKRVLGALVLVLLAFDLVRQKLNWTRLPGRWWFVSLVGLLAGLATTVGNAAGPIMSIYLISRGLQKTEFMGTRAWYFMIVNVCKLPVFVSLDMITLETVRFDAWMAPVVALSAFSGRWVFERISQRLFKRVVLVLAGIAALYLLLSS